MTYGRHPDCVSEPLTIWDFPDKVVDSLEDAGIPDYLASDLAMLMSRDYSNDALSDFVKAVRLNIEPIVKKYGETWIDQP